MVDEILLFLIIGVECCLFVSLFHFVGFKNVKIYLKQGKKQNMKRLIRQNSKSSFLHQFHLTQI